MGRKDGGHSQCYLVANGDDGNTYYRFVKKYSDAHETEFKKDVMKKAGGCRSVKRDTSEPKKGTEI